MDLDCGKKTEEMQHVVSCWLQTYSILVAASPSACKDFGIWPTVLSDPTVDRLWRVQATHHQLILGSGDAGQDVDAVGREVASVFGPVVDAMSPAGVHHVFSIMFVQNDQISFGEAEEGGVHSHCEVKHTHLNDSGCR